MTRKFIFFFGAFSIGALIALVVRASLFDPHAVGDGGEAPVTTALTPKVKVTDPHEGHVQATETAPTTVAPAEPAPSKPKTVNTVCGIC